MVKYKGIVLEVVKGDITKLKDLDAIVNPANSQMVMGGGVAGAIKRAGGKVIEDEARRHAPVPVGKAVATTAGKLAMKYVIHAPTMEYPAMRTTTEKVRAAVNAALNLCKELGIRTIAFPGMGTGVGGLNPRVAAEVIVDSIVKHVSEGTTLRKILLVAFDDKLYRSFREAVEGVLTRD